MFYCLKHINRIYCTSFLKWMALNVSAGVVCDGHIGGADMNAHAQCRPSVPINNDKKNFPFFFMGQ